MSSFNPASILSTAAPSPFIAAVAQKAMPVSLPILCTAPLARSASVSAGVMPSSGTSASPRRKAEMKAVIYSQRR